MEVRRLEFSNRSLIEIIAISEYIEYKWSIRSKDKFLELLNKNINLIKSNPNLFQVSNYANIHRCVVSKQTSVYFKFNSELIQIVSVFDLRQNPNKITKTDY